MLLNSSPPVSCARVPRPKRGSLRRDSSLPSSPLVYGPPAASAEYPVVAPNPAACVHTIASHRQVALGAQPGGVHRVDAHVRAVGGVDDTQEEAVHRCWNGDAFGKEDQALAPRDSSERADDREQAVGGGVSLLVAFHDLEVANHVRLHLRQLRLARCAAHGCRRPRAAGCLRARRRCPRHRRLLVGIGLLLLLLGAVEPCRRARAQLGQGLAQCVGVSSERRVRSHRQIDAEDADVVRRLFLGPEVSLRRLHGQPAGFRSEPIEHERDDARPRVLIWALNLCDGRGGRRSRSRRGQSSGTGTFQDRRERPDRLRHPVFQHVEVGGGQIANGLPALVANHHVDQHGGDALLQDVCRALRGRLLRVTVTMASARIVARAAAP